MKKGYEYGVLHFQFVNWRNLLIKQAWYRCLEKIRFPKRSKKRINDLYRPACDETNLGLKRVPKYWFDGYDFFDPSLFDEPEQWREKQILGWFEKHGKDYFTDLEIWNIDWGKGLNNSKLIA